MSINVLVKTGQPQAEVQPQKAAAFVARIQTGQEVTQAARAEGLTRSDLASSSFREAMESLLPFVPATPTEGRQAVLAVLYQMMLSATTDEKTKLGAIDRLQKDPSLGFMTDGPVVEVSVLSPEIRALPLPSNLAADQVVEVKPESAENA